MGKKRARKITEGIGAGLIGGLAASWIMNQFQAALGKLQTRQREMENAENTQSTHQGSPPEGEDQEPATVKAAVAISRKVLRQGLPAKKKEAAGQAVHYAYGTVVGGLYGAVAEVLPEASTGAGVLFGSLLWLVSDEIAVPAVGLSKAPAEYPVSVHASALGAHIVYGMATELVRRALRKGFLAQ